MAFYKRLELISKTDENTKNEQELILITEIGIIILEKRLILQMNDIPKFL
jgi:hypothetical protein